jgi:hypothetical protein
LWRRWRFKGLPVFRQPLFLGFGFVKLLPLFLIAAALPLSACGKNSQSGQAQNADEGLSAENIVANDVTAIDAVTGDAANMAADVNYEEALNEEADLNAAPPVSKPTPRHPAGNSAANAASNATE